MTRRKLTTTVLLATALAAIGAKSTDAAILAEYTFAAGSLTSSDTDPNSTASVFGNGAFDDGDAGTVTLGFGFSNTERSTNVTDVASFVYSKADALTFGYTFNFDVTPVAGYRLDITGVEGSFRRSGSGFESWAVDISDDGTTWTPLASVSNSFDTDLFAAGNGAVTGFDDLTGTFYVRIAIWRLNPGGGTGVRNFLDDFRIHGQSELIPEPASLALLALGGVLMLPRRRAGRSA